MATNGNGDGAPTSGLERSYDAAIRAAENAADSADAWDHLEELAEQLGRTDDLSERYRAALERTRGSDAFALVAERAVQFHEEWFGDSPQRIDDLLGRIVEIDADAEWAFERLTVRFTSAGQWDALLTAYDQAIARSPEARRRQLLNDAAQAAKDFADQPDRAADYLRQLVALEPDNPDLAQSLERLFERSERFADLVELWTSQLATQAAPERARTQLRIASTWLDRLGDPGRALDQVRGLLEERPGDAEACAVAERVLAHEAAEPAQRRSALSLLRKHHLVGDRPDDVLRALTEGLERVDPDERRPLHRELGSRLGIAGRDEEAIEQYRALLLGDPTDADARKQLRQLSRRTGRHDLHADALTAAADASDEPSTRAALWLEAANVRRRDVEDAAGAITLYERVLSSEDVEPRLALSAAHALDELLAEAGRDEDRLAVLERLAQLERTATLRRSVHAAAARLALTLGQLERAQANWQPVLAENPQDLEALGALVDLHRAHEQWEPLVARLRQRAAATTSTPQKRADLVAVARIFERELSRSDEAIEVWLAVKDELGEAEDVRRALDRLLTEQGRFEELANVLETSTRHTRGATVATFRRLGDLFRGELDRPDEALPWYDAALAIAPDDEGAREAVQALLQVESCAHDAGEILARVFRSADDAAGLLQLLEHRLSQAHDVTERGELLREAARIHVDRKQDPASALSCLGRALALEPANLGTEAALVRLAEATGRWTTVAASCQLAAETAADRAPRRAAELRMRQGRIAEIQLEDPDQALDAYREAHRLDPERSDAQEAIVRCAAALGRWPEATAAAVAVMAHVERLRPDLLASLDDAATAQEAAAGLLLAFETALAERTLPPRLAQRLDLVLARWYRDRAADREAAVRAAERAAGGPRDVEALEVLVDLLRGAPSAALVESLTSLHRLRDGSVDALHEAARVALELSSESAPVLPLLEQLVREAGLAWLRNESSGTLAPSSVTRWALDQLLEQYEHTQQPHRAVQVLLDATRLPFEGDELIELRRRAAELLVATAHADRAIDLYRAILAERPEDVTALRRVAELCEDQGRISEALSFRLREIELVDDVERRLELRLDHARLTAELEARGGRVASLRQNLRDRPGHAPSIEAMVEVLSERGQWEPLATMLREQAELTEESDPEAAISLWSRAAHIAEARTNDIDAALEAHARVVSIAEAHASLDALARLHLARKEPGEAARWLERRLELAGPSERVAVLLHLARARVQADQSEGAVAALEEAFAEAPRNAEVRKLLFRHYRQQGRHEALAEALSRAALEVSDERAVLAYAREAATVFGDRLQAPARAVPALRRAVELAPDDRELALALAEGLRAEGSLDDAQALLERVIESYGRRRSRDRAIVHLELARVLHAAGQTTEAVAQLDAASQMAPGEATILRTLAELAEASDELDRAERAYRTLLVTARRDASLPVGPSEVLFQLSRLAARRDQPSKAEELVESALDTLGQRPDEAPRIERMLRAQGDDASLERFLRHRLEREDVAPRRAMIVAALADLEARREQPERALGLSLEAVETDPSSPVVHQAAWDRAVAAGALDRYLTVVEALLSDERADQSPHVRCELLLRLGAILEQERGDLERARTLYGQAEATGVRTVDVWRAQARVAGALGDSEGQMQLLAQLANLGEDQAETRSDAQYRLAEVQLAEPATVDDGVASLEAALGQDFRAERAALVLRVAVETHPEHGPLLELYEQVARRSGDPETLLHALARRARHSQATMDQVREAAELALAQEQRDEAEALMLRATELGHAGSRQGDRRGAAWAVLGLARLRADAGDLPGTVRWLTEATELTSLEDVFPLAEQVADLAAQPDGDLTLATKLYEHLLEQAPTDPRAWRPLARLYGALGDVAKLERIVEETLDGLQEAQQRHDLRVALAHAWLASGERTDDAVTALGAVLEEDPQRGDARALLVDHLEREGRTDELVELLQRQLRAAEERADLDAVAAVSFDLVGRLEPERPDAALAVLRRARSLHPDGRELTSALLTRLEDDPEALLERLDLMEALLASDDPDDAVARARALVSLCEVAEEPDRGVAALEVALRRAPGDPTLLEHLRNAYRDRDDHPALQRLLLEVAERTEDPSSRADILAEAATIRREHLGDPAGAAELLRQASAAAPGQVGLRLLLAETLGAAGDLDAAIVVVSEVLDGELADDPIAVHRIRARLYRERGDLSAAAADLEAAYARDPERAVDDLDALLAHQIALAGEAGDGEGERTATLRRVDLLQGRGDDEGAAALLTQWIGHAAEDVEALRRLRDLHTSAQRWEEVIATCDRLVQLEDGGAQLDAALGLSHACHEVGAPDRARTGLERARADQPEATEIRNELKRIYDKQGDHRELAQLLAEDAERTEGADRAALLAQAGKLLITVGDAAAALGPLREAHGLLPDDSKTTLALVDALILADAHDEAKGLVQNALDAVGGRRSVDASPFYHRMATLIGRSGDHLRQMELLQEAHNCNKKDGVIAAALADLAEELEQWELAAKTLRTITLIDDEDCPISRAQAFLRQGRLSQRQGDDKSARMWARRAKREDPDDELVDLFLDQLGERSPSIFPGRG